MPLYNHKYVDRQNRKEAQYQQKRYTKYLHASRTLTLSQQFLPCALYSEKVIRLGKHTVHPVDVAPTEFNCHEKKRTEKKRTGKRRNRAQTTTSPEQLLEVSQLSAIYQSVGLLGRDFHPAPVLCDLPSCHWRLNKFHWVQWLLFLQTLLSMVKTGESYPDDRSVGSAVMRTDTQFSDANTFFNQSDYFLASESQTTSKVSTFTHPVKKSPHHEIASRKTIKHANKSNSGASSCPTPRSLPSVIHPKPKEVMVQDNLRIGEERSESPKLDLRELFQTQETWIFRYLEMVRPMGTARLMGTTSRIGATIDSAVVYQYPQVAFWPVMDDLRREAERDSLQFMNCFSEWLGRSEVSKESLKSSAERTFFDKVVDKIFNVCLLDMATATPEAIEQLKKRVDLHVMIDLANYLVHRFPKYFSPEEFRRLGQEKSGERDMPRYFFWGGVTLGSMFAYFFYSGCHKRIWNRFFAKTPAAPPQDPMEAFKDRIHSVLKKSCCSVYLRGGVVIIEKRDASHELFQQWCGAIPNAILENDQIKIYRQQIGQRDHILQKLNQVMNEYQSRKEVAAKNQKENEGTEREESCATEVKPGLTVKDLRRKCTALSLSKVVIKLHSNNGYREFAVSIKDGFGDVAWWEDLLDRLSPYEVTFDERCAAIKAREPLSEDVFNKMKKRLSPQPSDPSRALRIS